jgi:UDP-glucose 4-epimerase
VINIGTGEQTSIADVWSRIAGLVDGADALVPVHGPARLHDVQRFAVAPVRARIHLGWSPWTGLDEGLARLTDQVGRGERHTAPGLP